MKNVLLIDSGSGGINILKECVKVAPRCNFLLFCDAYNKKYPLVPFTVDTTTCYVLY